MISRGLKHCAFAGLFLVLSSQAEHPVPKAPVGQEVQDNLTAENATDQASVIKWVRKNLKDLPTNHGDPNTVIATMESESSAGSQRVIYSEHSGGNIFSFFHGGTTELLIDTESAEGFKPHVIQPGKTHVEVREGTHCQTCHGIDFTPIWDTEAGARFYRGPGSFESPLKELAALKVYPLDFANVLVKRAARNTFEKLRSRRPARFREHAPLILKLLVNCAVSNDEWNEFLKEVRQDSPELIPQWSKIFEGGPAFFRVRLPDENPADGLGSPETSIRPLFVLHYLGIPPQNLFLMKPIEEKTLFDSLDNFAQLNDSHFRRSSRFGPLGAYGAENDDLRGHLAARIALNVFPGIQYSMGKDYVLSDLEAFLNISPGQSSTKKGRHTAYSQDMSFLFNIYGLYGIIPAYDDPPPPNFAEEKKKWCDQLTAANARFDFLTTEARTPATKEKKTSKPHEKAKPVGRRPGS